MVAKEVEAGQQQPQQQQQQTVSDVVAAAATADDKAAVSAAALAAGVGVEATPALTTATMADSDSVGEDVVDGADDEDEDVDVDVDATESETGRSRSSGAEAEAETETEAGKKARIGRWTKDEHERFLRGVALYGPVNWAKTTELIGTRTAEQVRSHAQKYFDLQRRLGKLEVERDPRTVRSIRRANKARKHTKAMQALAAAQHPTAISMPMPTTMPQAMAPTSAAPPAYVPMDPRLMNLMMRPPQFGNAPEPTALPNPATAAIAMNMGMRMNMFRAPQVHVQAHVQPAASAMPMFAMPPNPAASFLMPSFLPLVPAPAWGPHSFSAMSMPPPTMNVRLGASPSS